MNNNPLLDDDGEAVDSLNLFRLWDNDWNDWWKNASGKSIWTSKEGLKESFWHAMGAPLSDSHEYEIVVSGYKLVKEYTLLDDD